MPNVGEIWAYRTGGRSTLTPVNVNDINGRRALIEHLDPARGGLNEWVPIGRLKVPWEALDGFLEREARWDALIGPTRPPTPQSNAVWDIFLATIPEEVAQVYYNNATGVTEIHDLRRLSQMTGLEPTEIWAEETAFVEEETLYVPWAATVRIARAIAPKRAGRLLRQIAQTEAHEAAERADANQSKGAFENPEVDSKRARVLAAWRRIEIERRETVRLWAGGEEPSIADENAKLRAHLETLIELARRASEELPQARTKRATAVKVAIENAISDIRRDV
jgi:hypothetical protein